MTEPLNYEGPLAADVVKLVEDFLKTPVTTDDGWPELTTKDWKGLHEVFYQILEAKFQRDCDNDQGIEYALCDRKNGTMQTIQIPYGYESDEDVEQMMSAMGVAAGIIDRGTRLIGHNMAERRIREQRHVERMEKMRPVLDFLKDTGANMAWNRITDMLNPAEKRGLFIGKADDVWMPLGLTAKEIHDCARDFKGKQDRVDTLLIEAVQKIKGNI